MSEPVRPQITFTSITIATPEPIRLAEFYSLLLGVEINVIEEPEPGQPNPAGWAQIRTPTASLNFEYEQHWRAPVWPSQPGQQSATQHLDIRVDSLDAGVAWALACGARLADHQPQDDVRVLLDPSGHPLCLFEPGG
jgi:hypothetical protein